MLLEAAAAICNLFSGCYDGCLYVLRTDNGEIHWRFQAGGSEHPIKCSPSTDPQTGDVWFGSHDHHLYAVDIYVRHNITAMAPPLSI